MRGAVMSAGHSTSLYRFTGLQLLSDPGLSDIFCQWCGHASSLILRAQQNCVGWMLKFKASA